MYIEKGDGRGYVLDYSVHVNWTACFDSYGKSLGEMLHNYSRTMIDLLASYAPSCVDLTGVSLSTYLLLFH